MEKMNSLKDLLKHEVQDLYSAEEQIIEALPAMIGKVSNTSLKNSLKEHLRITAKHKPRLTQVLQLLDGGSAEENTKKKNFMALDPANFLKCKGMEGIINESRKMLEMEMDAVVKDAAMISCAQKVQHYVICGYGTARAYAIELELYRVANLLDQTLDEEYNADDKLSFLAESRINSQAEKVIEPSVPASPRETSGKSNPGARASQKERHFVPVTSKAQRSEIKNTGQSNRGGHSRVSITPAGTIGRSASRTSKGTGSPKETRSVGRNRSSGGNEETGDFRSK